MVIFQFATCESLPEGKPWLSHDSTAGKKTGTVCRVADGRLDPAAGSSVASGSAGGGAGWILVISGGHQAKCDLSIINKDTYRKKKRLIDRETDR